MTGEYSISTIIDPSKIDLVGIDQFMYEHKHCTNCNVVEKFNNKTRCVGCPYYPKSNRDKSGKRKRITCIAEIARILGVDPKTKQASEIGRSNLVYFYHHPELFWKLPELPKRDIFGNPNLSSYSWHLHHYKNEWEDDYLVRLGPREHRTIETMCKRGDTFLLDLLLITRERHPSLDPGQLMTVVHRKKYYKLWKKNEEGLMCLRDGIDLHSWYINEIGHMF